MLAFKAVPIVRILQSVVAILIDIATLTKIKEFYYKRNEVIVYRSVRIFLQREWIVHRNQTVRKYMNKELKLLSIVRRKKQDM